MPAPTYNCSKDVMVEKNEQPEPCGFLEKKKV